MIAKAKIRYARVSPTKVRQVIDLVRGQNVIKAQALLAHTNRGTTGMILKTLNSAVSNAKQKGLNEEQLFISKIVADQGPSWKRFRAVAFGRATGILKRTTHLTVELDVFTK